MRFADEVFVPYNPWVSGAVPQEYVTAVSKERPEAPWDVASSQYVLAPAGGYPAASPLPKWVLPVALGGAALLVLAVAVGGRKSAVGGYSKRRRRKRRK